jgi:hypothetical protein
MRRRINYTGRKKLREADLEIMALRREEGVPFLSVDLDLDDVRYGFPGESQIRCEVKYKNHALTFPMGTVGAPQPLRAQALNGIPNNPTSLRVAIKVVGVQEGRPVEGLYTGRLRPELIGGEVEEAEGLIEVAYLDLGEGLVWNLNLDDEPVLEVNTRVPRHKSLVEDDPIFHALVLPNVVKQVLAHIFLGEDPVDTQDPDGWACHWHDWAEQYAGPPPASAEVNELACWVDQVTDKFASGRQLLTRVIETINEETSS